MGQCQGWLFEASFNRSIKVREADPRITSNAGLVLLREADHRLGLTADLGAQLDDPRNPNTVRYTQTELLRQHLYALAIDPFPIEVHGKQPGGAYHGYYKTTIYQPLVASFSAEGNYDAPRLGEGFVHAILRRGNCSGAEGMVRGAPGGGAGGQARWAADGGHRPCRRCVVGQAGPPDATLVA